MAELSGFEVLVLAKEVDLALRGAYVNNIYTAGASQLVRFRKPGGDDLWLVVSPKKGVWISEDVSEREATSEFTSKLRGELERARFSGASQSDLDRVFVLKFEGKEERTLVVEMMPPGNIVAIDPEGRVRLVLNEVRSESRRILRGGQYSPPRQSRLSPADATADKIAAMLGEESTLGKAIGRHVGLPRKYVADALNRLGVADETPSATMKGREEDVARALRGMVELARSSPAPCICTTTSGDEIFAYHPAGLAVKKEGQTMSELCDALFLREALTLTPSEGPEESRRKELQATVAKLRAEADSLRARAAKLRESAKAARTSELEDAAKLVRDSGLRPSSGPTSPAGAASALFDHAKELEGRAEDNVQSAEKLEKKASRLSTAKQTNSRPIVKRKGEWFEKFRWFTTAEGRLAIGGRDAQTNSAILARHMDANDTVYHADLFGSPFFVLKGGKAQSEEEVREVAQATVAFSSAWKTGLGSADAYWVAPDQVNSAAPSGEYLAKGSFTIRGRKNYVPKLIVELAMGIDRQGKLAAGPESAVRRNCEHYVVLRPHNEKGSETAKRVLKDLTVEGAAFVPTLDDVQRALPAGGGKVVRRA